MNKVLAAFTLILAGCFCLPVYASMIDIDLNSVYPGGATPNGPAPWLQAELSYTPGETSGTLTLTSKLYSNSKLDVSNFVQGNKNGKAAAGWAFNLDQQLTSATCNLKKSSNCADDTFINSDLKSGPTGNYNLGFSWSSGRRLVHDNNATYELIFANPLSSSPFIANSAGFLSVAHIQGIVGDPSSNSSWVTDGPADVPEPSQISVLLIGLLCLGLMLYARRAALADPRV